MAESFCAFADALEACEDRKAGIRALIREMVQKHKRIIFNGNNYSAEWSEEAARRGLLDLKTAADALPYFVSEKNIALFEKHHVFTATEMRSRQEILLESYGKTLHIEALTMLDMARQSLLPTASKYVSELCDAVLKKRAVSEAVSTAPEEALVAMLSGLCDEMYRQCAQLDQAVMGGREHPEAQDAAAYYRDAVLPAMMQLRATADQIELNLAETYQPYPTYAELLFSL